MLKPKVKILISSFLLAVVMFVAVPKSYIHSLLGHKHNVNHTLTSEITVSENDETQDCNIQKFDTPVYYTVFKFILNKQLLIFLKNKFQIIFIQFLF